MRKKIVILINLTMIALISMGSGMLPVSANDVAGLELSSIAGNTESGLTLSKSPYPAANLSQSDVAIVAGFSTHFANMNNWTVRKGEWTIKKGTYLFTNGKRKRFSSVSYNAKYSTLTYKVKMKRLGSRKWPNNIIIRGKPTLVDEAWWQNCYLFEYSNVGKFSVWKGKNGHYTALKNWTIHNAINKENWNTLMVKASGNNLKFYINNKLVWQGTDSALSSGKVGIGMYKPDTTDVNKFWVDKASLTTSVSDPNLAEVLVPGVEVPGGTYYMSP